MTARITCAQASGVPLATQKGAPMTDTTTERVRRIVLDEVRAAYGTELLDACPRCLRPLPVWAVRCPECHGDCDE